MVTLRMIYLELGEIFAFPYEKNQNGSYRVNTVIRNLVYPELYTEKTWSENDLAYFLANPEYSYQAYPNIRNSFSELMNPKSTNRLPVTFLCEAIEIERMYRYYQDKIEELVREKQAQYKRLQQFLAHIFDEDATFHAKLKLSCSQEHEFLTWILIFSMFNKELANEKYETHLKSVSATLAQMQISESGERHKLSSYLIEQKTKNERRKKILYTLCAIEIFFALLPVVMQGNETYRSTYMSSSFSLFLLLFTILTLLLRIRYSKAEHRYSDLQAYHDFMNEFPDEEIAQQIKNGNLKIKLQPFKNTARTNTKRNTYRNVMKLCLYVCLIFSVVASFLLDSFPLIPVFVCICVLIFMYADRFYNDYMIRTDYDKKTLKTGEEAKPWRGLAKIYAAEYENTKFQPEHSYYKNTIHVHSGKCYQHIFYIAYDHLHYILYIYNVCFAFFTGLLLIIELLTIAFPDSMISYLHLPNTDIFHVIISIYILGVGLFTLTTLMTSSNNYENLSKLAYASKKAVKYPEGAEKLFLSMHAHGVIRNIDWMRGVFTYNMACFEDGMEIEDIYPETDRMLFYHRHIVFRAVAKITVILSYVIAVALFVWHMQMWYLLVPITAVCFFIYLYLYYRGLYRLNQKQIIRQIRLLSENPLCEVNEV